MASYKLYLDKRKTAEGAPCPVVIIVSHKNRTAHIPTGVAVIPTDIDMTNTKNNGKVIRGENRSRLSAVIAAKKMMVQKCLLDLTESGKLNTLDVMDIKRYIMNNGEMPIIEQKPLYKTYFDLFVANKTKSNTYNAYKTSIANIATFCDIDTLTFEEIDVNWIERYVAHLRKRGLSQNSIIHNLSLMSSVFSYAINHDIITYYPFKRIKLKRTPTQKRSLSVESLRDIIQKDLSDPHLAYWRDIFVLTFLLVGINSIDLYNLSKDALVDGRINYIRSKTTKPYSIRVEPEALALIKRHSGNKNLVSLADKYKRSENMSIVSSKQLKRIMPKLSLYWARHTWATIAYNIGISKEIISLALGHTLGSQTTSIYINPDIKKIDEANRKVIDYVYRIN